MKFVSPIVVSDFINIFQFQFSFSFSFFFVASATLMCLFLEHSRKILFNHDETHVCLWRRREVLCHMYVHGVQCVVLCVYV